MKAKYREKLPQMSADVFLTDGGLETSLIYLDGLELPCFAAFDLLKNEAGRAALERYFRTHAGIARERGVGFVLESATWRANADWGAKIGYSREAVIEANRAAIGMLSALRVELETSEAPMPISGCIGPRGDGYKVEARMTEDDAEAYHALQARVFAEAGADLVSAITMTYAEEAIGVVRAAQAAGVPVVVSFTTETDGRLPSGQALGEAIAQVDAATEAAPVYYMINCAHPAHFTDALAGVNGWAGRIRGVRANASMQSHAELDTATALDAGDPEDLAARCAALRERLPNLNVFGGCCGTDHRHIAALAEACGGGRKLRCEGRQAEAQGE